MRVVLVVASLLLSGAHAAAQAPTIPLCEGLKIVTVINQADGDYESIKTIETITGDAVRLKYSSERLVEDLLSADPPRLVQATVYRTIRRNEPRAVLLRTLPGHRRASLRNLMTATASRHARRPRRRARARVGDRVSAVVSPRAAAAWRRLARLTSRTGRRHTRVPVRSTCSRPRARIALPTP
jgi:hypothetical protein